MAALVIPPVKRPARHPRRQPIVLPPQLDKSCVLCLLPLRDNKWYNYSGKGNHGTIYGATWVSKGRWGPALSFDGVDDYVEIAYSQSLNTPYITVEAWVIYSGSTGAKNPIVARWGDRSIAVFNLAVNTSDFPQFEARDPNVTTKVVASTPIAQDTWYHLVGTYDSSYVRIYVNGVIAGETSATGDPLQQPTSNPVQVGKDQFDNYFYGIVNEVRIYNRALTADEIRALYELGR